MDYIDPRDNGTSVRVFTDGEEVNKVCKVDIGEKTAILECLNPAPSLKNNIHVMINTEEGNIFEVERGIAEAKTMGIECSIDGVCRLRYLLILDED